MSRKASSLFVLALLFSVTVLGFASPAPPAPASDKPDFSGTWIFDAQKSRLDARFKVDEGTFVLERKGDRFRFSRTFITGGKPDLFSYELAIDGPEETTKAPDRSVAQRLRWDGDALVYSAKTVLKDGRTANDIVRYTLEDGGRTFVAEESFRGPVLKYDNRWVADRKAAAAANDQPSAALAPADKPAAIEALVRAYQDAQTFNGAVLVAERGRVVFKKGFGPAVREWNVPNAPDTKFRIGSLTKQFTAMLVLQLVQDGRIDLDGRLAAYLPFYRKDVAGKVTIHHLLTHTSGIPDYTDQVERLAVEAVRDPYPPAEFVEKYCSGDLQFEPGSRFRYDNSGYFILGAVIEAVTGKPYEEVLRERILGPLGMKDTGCDRPVPLLARRAAGYTTTFDGFENTRYLNMSLPYAAGALYSTAEDLFLWDRALSGDRLLKPETKALLFQPHMAIGGGASYGYGWMVRRRPIPVAQAGTLGLFHGGAIFGFSSYIERLPEEGHLVVLLCNTPEADLSEIADGIIGILYGKTPAPPKRSVTRAIYRTLLDKGAAAAIAQYREIKRTAAAEYDLSPGELNQLGYYLLRTKKMTAPALEIFELNIAEYPKYGNGYIGLAEAFLAAGNDPQAVANYKKVLELDPGNADATARLAEILKR